MTEPTPMKALVEFSRPENLAGQLEQVRETIALAERLGPSSARQGFLVWLPADPTADDPASFLPLTGDLAAVRHWLAAHDVEDLHHQDVGIMVLGTPEISIHLTPAGGDVQLTEATPGPWPGPWPDLLVGLAGLWDADRGAVSRLGEFFDSGQGLGQAEQLAGLLTYTRTDPGIDPALAETRPVADGWLVTATDQRPETIKAIRNALAETDPAARAAIGAPPTRDAATDYTVFITGVQPSADGSLLQLAVGDVAFPGYVNRAGADIYLRAIHLPEQDLAGLDPTPIVTPWLAQAAADVAAVRAVRPAGIVEYHCNNAALAELLRFALGPSGVQVFYTPQQV